MTRLRATTSQERAALHRASERLQHDYGFAPSFGVEELIEHWATAVQQVEDGYSLGFYDFTHDLDLRDALDELSTAIPERLKLALERELEPLDARFFAATREVPESLLPSADGESPAAWWFRVPLIVRPLAEDDSWHGVTVEL